MGQDIHYDSGQPIAYNHLVNSIAACCFHGANNKSAFLRWDRAQTDQYYIETRENLYPIFN